MMAQEENKFDFLTDFDALETLWSDGYYLLDESPKVQPQSVASAKADKLPKTPQKKIAHLILMDEEDQIFVESKGKDMWRKILLSVQLGTADVEVHTLNANAKYPEADVLWVLGKQLSPLNYPAHQKVVAAPSPLREMEHPIKGKEFKMQFWKSLQAAYR